METKIFNISKLNEDLLERAQVFCEEDAIADMDNAMALVREAGRIISNGGLVVFPTETVYGIGANALDENAARKVYEAKGRPSDNPMIVHIARASDLSLLAEVLPTDAVRLADAFWPGPLTIILKKKSDVPDVTTGGLDTVAVRMPDHPAAAELIRAACVPVAAPSANLSGGPSPTTAEHAIRDMSGRVDAILAGGECRVGIESTVVDLTTDPPEILRPGIISAEDISEILKKPVIQTTDQTQTNDPVASLDSEFTGNASPSDATHQTTSPSTAPQQTASPDTASQAPRSPGMKYTHYAPKAEMIIIKGNPLKVRAELERLRELNERIGRKVGIIPYDGKDTAIAAQDYYAHLRRLDDLGVDLIIAQAVPDEDGAGFALMNRMMRSAGYRIIHI